MNKLQKRMFSELLYQSGVKTEDGKGYVLNKFAIQLATFFLCTITRDEYSHKSNIVMPFETLGAVGHHFSKFAGWDEDVPPNRIHEALECLEKVGFLYVSKCDANSDQRDNYGYRDKTVLDILINLEGFGVDE